MSNTSEKERLDALLEKLAKESDRKNNYDKEDDEDEKNESKIIKDSYIFEIEEKLRPVYDKFVHGADSGAFVILNTKSVDYNELFSYLGQRITKNMYENSGSSNNGMDAVVDGQTAFSIELKTIEANIKRVKYFTPGNVPTDPVLPAEGMTSEEYEKWKMWKITNPAMVKFYMDFL